MNTRYQLNGHYTLDEVYIETVDGILDLSSVFVGINLFESMEDIAMSGNIEIIDMYNLTEIMPIYGDEKIYLNFYTAGNEKNPIEFFGRLYKVTPKKRLTEHSVGQILYFSSELLVKSERVFVNQGYEDQQISSIVRDIYTRFISVQKKPLRATETKGRHTLTLGNVHPVESISRLSKKAVSTNSDHGYVFFENNQEVVYKPLQEMYKQPPVAKYAYLNKSIYQEPDKKYEEQFESVQEYEIYDENSFLDRIYDGLHGSKHVMFDLITKEYLDSDDQVDYEKRGWFDKEKSLGKEPDRTDIEKKEDELFLTFGYGEQDKLLHHDFIDSKMKHRESQIFKADITVFGDSRLRTGDVLDIYIPNYNIDQQNLKSIYTGKFIISRIRHFMTRTEYLQVIHIRKDAYEEKSL